MKWRPESYGIHYLQSIVSVRLLTRMFWSATYGQVLCGAVFPGTRHQAVGKETGEISYIERFNNTLRQRVSRLVRKT